MIFNWQQDEPALPKLRQMTYAKQRYWVKALYCTRNPSWEKICPSSFCMKSELRVRGRKKRDFGQGKKVYKGRGRLLFAFILHHQLTQFTHTTTTLKHQTSIPPNSAPQATTTLSKCNSLLFQFLPSSPPSPLLCLARSKAVSIAEISYQPATAVQLSVKPTVAAMASRRDVIFGPALAQAQTL